MKSIISVFILLIGCYAAFASGKWLVETEGESGDLITFEQREEQDQNKTVRYTNMYRKSDLIQEMKVIETKITITEIAKRGGGNKGKPIRNTVIPDYLNVIELDLDGDGKYDEIQITQVGEWSCTIKDSNKDGILDELVKSRKD
jgi:hypothetical protein